MPINYIDTELDILSYHDTELDKVIYDTTTVYQRITVNYYSENNSVKSVKVISGKAVSLSSSNAASKTGWTFLGWRKDKTASATVESSITAGTSTINLYAVYRQTITLSYNGNGNTGGSTAAQTGYRYYNNTNIVNPSFTLRSNGFSKSGYSFVNWRMGSASGTAYNTGANVTLSANTTFYAYWSVIYTTSVASFPTGQVQNQSGEQSEYVYPTFYYTRSLTGNCLSWESGTNRLIANCACKLSVSINMHLTEVDGASDGPYAMIRFHYGANSYLFSGGGIEIINAREKDVSFTLNNISCSAGDILYIGCAGRNYAGNGRMNFREISGKPTTITATPI